MSENTKAATWHEDVPHENPFNSLASATRHSWKCVPFDRDTHSPVDFASMPFTHIITYVSENHSRRQTVKKSTVTVVHHTKENTPRWKVFITVETIGNDYTPFEHGLKVDAPTREALTVAVQSILSEYKVESLEPDTRYDCEQVEETIETSLEKVTRLVRVRTLTVSEYAEIHAQARENHYAGRSLHADARAEWQAERRRRNRLLEELENTDQTTTESLSRHVPPVTTEKVEEAKTDFVQGNITVNEMEARIEDELTTTDRVPLTEAH